MHGIVSCSKVIVGKDNELRQAASGKGRHVRSYECQIVAGIVGGLCYATFSPISDTIIWLWGYAYLRQGIFIVVPSIHMAKERWES